MSSKRLLVFQASKLEAKLPADRAVRPVCADDEVCRNGLSCGIRRVERIDPCPSAVLPYADHTVPKAQLHVRGAGEPLEEVASVLRHATTVGKIAIVASKDVEFGMARMVELLADESPTEIRVFRAVGEAESWLGIE